MVYNPAGSGTYFLGSSIGSTDTSILLSSFLEPVSGTPYTMALLNTSIVYGTIAPGTSSSEFVSFTGITQNANGTALLTTVTRGLAKKYPFTSDTTFKLPHSGQSIFILSDAPQVFKKYGALDNDEIVSGNWDFTGVVTFSNFPITPSNTPATTSVLGVVKTSVAPANALSPIAVETTDPRVPVAYAVDSVGTDAYAVTPSPAETAYVTGKEYTFKAGTSNTGPATLNVSALGAKTIVKGANTTLVTGDILSGEIVVCKYDGTNMQMINPRVIDVSTQATGVLAIANGGTAIATLNYNSGNLTGPTTSTTTNIAHGLGKTPTWIRINCYGSSGTAGDTKSIGTYNGTNTATIYTAETAGGTVAHTDSSNIINLNVISGGGVLTATAAINSTNIVLTSSASGGGVANFILWEAWGF